MTRSKILLTMTAALVLSQVARADLYRANQALANKDFKTAFSLYLELAELGRLEAQESVALAYVNGEGVARDNVAGYAWAAIARENGGSADMQNIIDQLESHLTDAARKRVDALRANYGVAGVRHRLMPEARAALPRNYTPCKPRKFVDPNAFFPPAAMTNGTSGTVELDFPVLVDGRARNPSIVYSIPTGVFEQAARAVILKTRFEPAKENGVDVPCHTTMRIIFDNPDFPPKVDENELSELEAKARTGDPNSQLRYGLVLTDPHSPKVRKDNPFDWYMKAAQAGIPAAQYITGTKLLGDRRWPDAMAKGRQWIEFATARGQPDAELSLAKLLLLDHGDPENPALAQGLMEKAVAAGLVDARLYLAALLAAGPDADHRDPKRALELMSPFSADLDMDPSALDICAAAEAQLGDFDAAVDHQTAANRKAGLLGWDPAPGDERLARYKAHQTWTGELFVP